MIYGIYTVSLKFKTPSELGRELNFQNKTTDVLESILEFNNKYSSWSKRLILLSMGKNHMNLLLVLEKSKDKISTREIRSFTAYLRREKNWSVYSKDPTKLFEGFNFRKIMLNESIKLISSISADLVDLQRPHLDIITDAEAENVVNNHQPQNIESHSDLTDDQAIAILKYLQETKHLGAHNIEKQETIIQIKDLLVKWV